MPTAITREQVLHNRVRAQQLASSDTTLDDAAALDLGVQDTGSDGSLWALANRGIDVSKVDSGDLATVWTIRGAPHVYRRHDLPAVATAVAPFSEEDASKRIHDAAKPLKAAGIATLDALDAVAAAMRSVVVRPMVKGEVSARVAELMAEPYLRYCRPCAATHLYEMPFRLAALRAGLELQRGTSPPVLQRLTRFKPASSVASRFDVIHAYLRLLGPATPKHVADYLDAPLKDVKDRWPADAVEVSVDGERRWVLDLPEPDGPGATGSRLLGPFDPFLQARDRSLLVDHPAQAKTLWPVLGRPGAVLSSGHIIGVWRPRQAGKKLTVAVELWRTASAALRRDVAEQAERLADHRQVQLAGVDVTT